MSPAESPEIDLLLDWQPDHSRSGFIAIYGASVLINLFLLLVVSHLPAPTAGPAFERNIVWDQTPLYLPRDVLTQKEPNRSKITKRIDLADLLASRERTRQAAAPKPSPEQQIARNVPKVAPQIAPEAPQPPATNRVNAPPPPGRTGGTIAPVPPPVTPANTPFQDIGGGGATTAHPTLAPPKAGVEAAINGLAQNASARDLIVTDTPSVRQSPGDLGSISNAPAQHAAVELKSDPQGADMKPYLTRILAIVRANWRTVTPESARLGTRRGCTVVEFAISRNGNIPKIVVADSSGSDPLDRAAAAGLMMSNPLPPLPPDYRGLQVRLAFSFSYNLPKGSCGE